MRYSATEKLEWPPKVCVLKAWSSAWCCLNVVELFKENQWKVICHWGGRPALEGNHGTPVSSSFSLLLIWQMKQLCYIMCSSTVICCLTTGPKPVGPNNRRQRLKKHWAKIKLFLFRRWLSQVFVMQRTLTDRDMRFILFSVVENEWKLGWTFFFLLDKSFTM